MIKFIFYILALAMLLAKLELMIEGKRWGWAYKLPCWRVSNKLIDLILGKELTGYHFWLVLMFGFIFHSYFLFNTWNIDKELYLLSVFTLFWVVEDWCWFLFNDYYGLHNFKKGRIFWHKRWLCGIPCSYWSAILLSALFFVLGYAF